MGSGIQGLTGPVSIQPLRNLTPLQMACTPSVCAAVRYRRGWRASPKKGSKTAICGGLAHKTSISTLREKDKVEDILRPPLFPRGAADYVKRPVLLTPLGV